MNMTTTTIITRTDFDAALLTHLPALRRRAHHLMAGAPDASDLVQDTLERALRHFQMLELQSNVWGWLVTIMQRLLIDHYRKERTRRRSVPIETVEVPARPEYQAPPWEHVDRAEIEAAVDVLPPALAAAFRLRVFERLPGAAVGQQLGIPLCTVHTRVLRARRKLHDILKKRALSAGRVPAIPTGAPS
jgi:RNA polymerase sigma-70 factor (ECF subfamily)